MNRKVKLGYGISLPVNVDKTIPDYDIENINQIKLWSKKFYCVQIMFTKTKLSVEQIKEIKSIVSGYKAVYIHASYQINMGADLIPGSTDLYSTGIEIFLNEIAWAKKIGARGIVVHMGKNVAKRYDPDHIYNNMVKFIIELFKKLKKNKIGVPVLLETPAGQGGEMCWELSEFIEFIQRFSSQPFYSQLQICLDTCHMFQAGIDLNNSKVIKQTHQILEVVKDKISLIHLNDSFHPVGSHIDRHEQIGKGHIQIDNLIKFIYPYRNIPMVLETVGPYEEQIKLIENK